MERKQKKKVGPLDEIEILFQNKVEIDDGERDDNELSDMDKLPPEILTKILDYLDKQELVKCRLLSTRWNEISCLLLQDKANGVSIQKPPGEFYLQCTTVITKPLYDFLNVFSPSKIKVDKLAGPRHRPFPFSHFNIGGVPYMQRNQMTQLVPLFRHIKSLFLEITSKETKNMELLWRLILKFAPNIEHLRLAGARWYQVDYFEPYFNFKYNSDPLEVVEVGSTNKSLDEETTFLNTKLKTLEIVLQGFETCMEDWIKKTLNLFLEHSPNLQELKCHEPVNSQQRYRHEYDYRGLLLRAILLPWRPIFGQFHLLYIWQKLSRAHLLKKLEIKNILDGSQRLGTPAELMKNLRLELLSVPDLSVSSGSVENEKSITNYIFHALKSSQNTLSSLDLQNLTVESMNLCFKDISSFPNVRQLKIQNKEPSENGRILEKFSQLFPNLKSLNLDSLQGEFSPVARMLWTGFTGLKSLKLTVNMTHERNDLSLVDSALSGYSQESIQNIVEKLDAGILMEEARRGEMQNPSILDLKDLSHLELEFHMGKVTTDEMENFENQLCNSAFMKILHPTHCRKPTINLLLF